jgi:hypothetical protein
LFFFCSLFFLSFFFSSFSPPSEGDIYKGQGGRPTLPLSSHTEG